MRGARGVLLALLLARLAAAAELPAGAARGAAPRAEATAPRRGPADRVAWGGARIPAAGALRGRPAPPPRRRRAPRAPPRPRPRSAAASSPETCGLRRPGAVDASRRTGGSRSVNQVCVEKSLVFRTNTPYHTDTISVPGEHDLLFCVQLDDSKLNYFQQPQPIKESDFLEFSEKYGRLSFLAVSQVQPSFSAFYRVPIDGTLVESMKVKIIPVTPPRAPYMKDNTCNNAVSEVTYEIEFNGTHGIQSVSVRFKVTNISGNSGVSLQQHFTLHFWTRTPSHTLPRSGNPGFIIGAPLLIANTGATQHMSILRSEGDGSCSQFLRHTVQFGKNMRTGCKLSLPQTEESNCSYIQMKLYEALQGMNTAEDLAITSSARSTQVEEWTTILIQNCSVQAMNCTSCCMVPVTLNIQILWTKVGLLSNPQAQILSARYSYQCHLLKLLDVSLVPLTTVVTFADMTEWPEPPHGQPKIQWKLPFDFFFPFKVVLNGERSYRGDLAAYFLLILILSSIPCL
ncbi:tectonic-3 isoform X3 [Anas platyrhynchos]|uniref:tectonic-3 isoform X3 n=1 Tax=Anas platyrhynchos TaxID=8839 RepID=UPI003AF29F05